MGTSVFANKSEIVEESRIISFERANEGIVARLNQVFGRKYRLDHIETVQSAGDVVDVKSKAGAGYVFSTNPGAVSEAEIQKRFATMPRGSEGYQVDPRIVGETLVGFSYKKINRMAGRF